MEENKKNLSDKILLPLSIVIAGLIIAGGVYLNGRIAKESPTPAQEQRAKSENLSDTIRPIDANDHILGNSKARVLIVEYSDTECPFCKNFHSSLLSTSMDRKRSLAALSSHLIVPIAAPDSAAISFSLISR